MYRRTQEETRILVLAPVGRDANLIAATLSTGGLIPAVCPMASEFASMLREGAAAAVIAEEALSAQVLTDVGQWIASQPPWSDFPFVVMTFGGRPSPKTSKRTGELQALGNVTFLERPVRPDTILSSLRAALRARLRQYEMRHRQENLAQVNADLEQFAHSASHDLREPIRNIAIYSELLEHDYSGSLDEQPRQYLEFMKSGASAWKRWWTICWLIPKLRASSMRCTIRSTRMERSKLRCRICGSVSGRAARASSAIRSCRCA